MIPVPKIEGKISHDEIKKKLPQTLLNKAVIYLVDREYNLTTKEEIERFLIKDRTDTLKYVKEMYDCDDFSFRLMGQFSIPKWASLAVGIAFSNVHAFNLMVDNRRRIWICEPQSDSLWEVDKIPKKYKKYFVPIRFVLM